MARKNLLAGLTGVQLPAGNYPAGAAPEGGVQATQTAHFGIGGTRSAIGAVSRSIEYLRAQSVVDIAPDLVEASFVSDRLDGSRESHAELLASIREHGQQVPILVRPHPAKEGRYQIAYGRRRLRVAAELGRSIRAVVKSLTDDQLVVAQGQENSARTDLSFIEKALFAARLEENGFGRDIIMSALSVDKSGLSRLISSAVNIPRDIIEAIGPAPKAGRDRWVELSVRLDSAPAVQNARSVIDSEILVGKSSDYRFNHLFDAAVPKKPKPARAKILKADDGTRVARIKDDSRSLAVIVDKRTLSDFGVYLVESLPEIYAAFKRRGEA